MFSKTTYILNVTICFLIAVATKNIRSESLIGDWTASALANAPSFLYTFGILGVPALFIKNISYRTNIKIMTFISAGSLAYEFEQFWTARTFDIGDILAILLALCIATLAHHIKEKHTTSQDPFNGRS